MFSWAMVSKPQCQKDLNLLIQLTKFVANSHDILKVIYHSDLVSQISFMIFTK